MEFSTPDTSLLPDGAIGRPGGAVDEAPELLFAVRELEDRESGALKLHPGFADALASLRMAFGRPMIVTSACRTAGHNRAIGGHPRSLHICDVPQHPGQEGTLAIDIRRGGLDRRGDAYDATLVRLALGAGWSVGVARTFLHLDRRDLIGLPQDVFGYGP